MFAVTSPVLVQWGLAGSALPKEIQCEIARANNAKMRVVSYPGLGHKSIMEGPVRTARYAVGYINDEDVGGRRCGA